MKSLLPLLFLLVCAGAYASPSDTTLSLPRSSPERQGISSAAVLDFVETADREIDAMHSFMLVRNGHVVAEGWWAPYDAESPHVLFSLSKSFTSTAVGLAIAEGKLRIDDPVLKFFPDEAPAEPSDNLRAMRVHDLLRMSTGHQEEPRLPWDGSSWVRAFLAHPVPFKPGTHFLYNTPATYMLSAIVQKVTGETVLDYLRPRLFEPLGIEDPQWGTSPEGITLGGYGLSVRTEDIARFGQLYLQKGTWNGRQLIPAAWVEAATALQTANGSNPESDWDQGYGYQFWRSRHGLYRGDGAFGQFCIVMPEQNAVVAITSGVRDMQAVMNLVWEKLLPAMTDGPLPENPAARQQLAAKLASLTVKPVSGQATSPLAATVSGKEYVFPENPRGIEAVRFDFGGSEPALVVRASGGESRIPFAAGAWKKGRSRFVNGVGGYDATSAEHAVAGSGAWTADDVFTLKLALYETPFHTTMAFRFDGDRLLLDAEHNVSFGPTTLPQLVGHVR